MSDRRGVAGDACDAVSLTALEPAVAEAVDHMRRLHKALDDGLPSNHKSPRAKVARLTGVPISYLLRLHQRAEHMPDVSGKYARMLRLACEDLDARTALRNRQSEALAHDYRTIRDAVARRRGAARVADDEGAAGAGAGSARGAARKAAGSKG